jgi:hypothetical protein
MSALPLKAAGCGALGDVNLARSGPGGLFNDLVDARED